MLDIHVPYMWCSLVWKSEFRKMNVLPSLTRKSGTCVREIKKKKSILLCPEKIICEHFQKIIKILIGYYLCGNLLMEKTAIKNDLFNK